MNQKTRPRFEIAGKSDVGRERESNEDAIGWDIETGVAALADGMGGHNAGEVASDLAVETIVLTLADRRPIGGEDGCLRAVRTAVEQANGIIHDAACERPQCSGMGTTAVVLCLDGFQATVAHVGDSRAYRLRDGNLEQLTSDHSVVQELVDSGFLSSEQAAASVNRNVITRALGVDATVQVDVQSCDTAPGDVFMLCSDGLSDMVNTETVLHCINRHNSNLKAAAQALIDAANEAGGKDNVSVILFRLLGSE